MAYIGGLISGGLYLELISEGYYPGGLIPRIYVRGAYIRGFISGSLYPEDLYIRGSYIWGTYIRGLVSSGLYLGAYIWVLRLGAFIRRQLGAYIGGVMSGVIYPGAYIQGTCIQGDISRGSYLVAYIWGLITEG